MKVKTAPHSIEVLDVLKHVKNVLDNSAINDISEYVISQQNSDGGFSGRDGKSDLYYTMFGLSCSTALGLELKLTKAKHYIESYTPETLDLVHLMALAKSFGAIKLLSSPEFGIMAGKSNLLKRFVMPKPLRNAAIQMKHHKFDSYAYDMFMLMNLCQDCGIEPPNIEELKVYQRADGGYANREAITSSSLNATVSAILLERQLNGKVNPEAQDWLEQQQTDSGGFIATPETIIPDMLSTATALFCLKQCNRITKGIKSRAKTFILDHWREDGGFSATLVDEKSDIEYTFYGLLAIASVE